MAVITLKPAPYRPSSPLSGDEAEAVYRGKNLVLRGTAPQVIYEAYPGSENLNETFTGEAITGTLTFDTSSDLVSGSGTVFLDELHIGQKLLAEGGEPLAVVEIISNTSFRNGRIPSVSATNETAVRAPRLFPLDISRGAALSGNAVHFDRGTLIGVGSGTL